MDLIHIIVLILIGALVGWLASLIMKSSHILLITNINGVVGTFLGGWIASLLHIGGGLIVEILVGIGGSCLLIFLYRLIFGKGKKKKR